MAALIAAERVDVYVFATGLDTKSLDIQLQQNLLTFSGKRELKMQENANYYLRERFSGEFRRVLSLPEDVDSEKVEANYRDGVLHTRLSSHCGNSSREPMRSSYV